MKRRRKKRERKNKNKKKIVWETPSVWRGETHPRLSFSFFFPEWLGKGRKRSAKAWMEEAKEAGARSVSLCFGGSVCAFSNALGALRSERDARVGGKR
ncbi:hypothetical protein AVEN_178393-1 [Araneus ventricosus]|uniref:Uncharacterized protein n=1 Tax=Araneus ventricosus TaxID=182803 RepID=A0A4Y2BE08_ARAVE|nr:hypothetical protein AVEN_178393-1 [Araneus ventricosus]